MIQNNQELEATLQRIEHFEKTEPLCYTEYESVHYCSKKKRSAKNDKRTSHT